MCSIVKEKKSRLIYDGCSVGSLFSFRECVCVRRRRTTVVAGLAAGGGGACSGRPIENWQRRAQDRQSCVA